MCPPTHVEGEREDVKSRQVHLTRERPRKSILAFCNSRCTSRSPLALMSSLRLLTCFRHIFALCAPPLTPPAKHSADTIEMRARDSPVEEGCQEGLKKRQYFPVEMPSHSRLLLLLLTAGMTTAAAALGDEDYSAERCDGMERRLRHQEFNTRTLAPSQHLAGRWVSEK